MITVYWIDLNDVPLSLISKYEGLLSNSDRQRYNRMKDSMRRLQFIMGRALIWNKCHQSPHLLPTGKPVVNGGYISLSHSGNIVALAVSENPIGLDIERKVSRSDYDRIAQRLNLTLTDDKNGSFYRGFTRFEASYKQGDSDKKYVQYAHLGEYQVCVVGSQENDSLTFIPANPDYL